jgi:hypothetical protein
LLNFFQFFLRFSPGRLGCFGIVSHFWFKNKKKIFLVESYLFCVIYDGFQHIFCKCGLRFQHQDMKKRTQGQLTSQNDTREILLREISSETNHHHKFIIVSIKTTYTVCVVISTRSARTASMTHSKLPEHYKVHTQHKWCHLYVAISINAVCWFLCSGKLQCKLDAKQTNCQKY